MKRAILHTINQMVEEQITQQAVILECKALVKTIRAGATDARLLEKLFRVIETEDTTAGDDLPFPYNPK